VLKTVYRSSCRDKHNRPRRDSNLGPLTPQSDAVVVVEHEVDYCVCVGYIQVGSCSSLDSFIESLASVEQPDPVGVILHRKLASYQDQTIRT